MLLLNNMLSEIFSGLYTKYLDVNIAHNYTAFITILVLIDALTVTSKIKLHEGRSLNILKDTANLPL